MEETISEDQSLSDSHDKRRKREDKTSKKQLDKDQKIKAEMESKAKADKLQQRREEVKKLPITRFQYILWYFAQVPYPDEGLIDFNPLRFNEKGLTDDQRKVFEERNKKFLMCLCGVMDKRENLFRRENYKRTGNHPECRGIALNCKGFLNAKNLTGFKLGHMEMHEAPSHYLTAAIRDMII